MVEEAVLDSAAAMKVAKQHMKEAAAALNVAMEHVKEEDADRQALIDAKQHVEDAEANLQAVTEHRDLQEANELLGGGGNLTEKMGCDVHRCCKCVWQKEDRTFHWAKASGTGERGCEGSCKNYWGAAEMWACCETGWF